MAEIKKISTELQLLNKFLDTSGSAGSSGSVLTSTSTGTSWVSAGTPGTGVYLPLSAGASYPLTGDLWLDDNSGASPSLYLQNGSNNYWRLLNGSTGIFSLKEGTSDRITILPGGNVGIGTTSPSNKLDVEGRIQGDNFVLGGSDSTVFYGMYRAGTETREVRLVSYEATPNSKVQLGFNNLSGSTYTFAPALTAKANLNVGIGTTSPGGIFEVFQQSTGRTRGDLLVDAGAKYVYVGRLSTTSGDVSSFKVRDRLNRAYFDVNTASKYISFNPEVGDITMQIASGYGFKVNGGQFNVNASSGNVGIGTTSPAGKFNSYISAARQLTHNGNGGDLSIISDNNNNPVMFIKGTGTAALLDIQGTQGQLFSVTDDLSGSIFAVADISGVPIFDVNSNGTSVFDGSVGIGTIPSSGTKLEVNGQTVINSTLASNQPGLMWLNNQTEIFSFEDNSGGGRLLLSDATVKVAISANSNSYFNGGNVGIGTTSPRDKLDVVGTAYINNLRVGFTGSPSPATSFFGTRGTFYNNAFQTNYMMHCASSATNLGFTRGPSDSSPLTFNAGDRTGATNAIGSITLTSAGTSYNTTSDYRLKENEEKISNAIDRLKNLKPIRFNWILEPEEEKVDGFLAHEVAEVVPEAVTGEKDAIDYKGDDDLQMLENSKLVPLLTAALQQAIDKIELLEQRIQSIENK